MSNNKNIPLIIREISLKGIQRVLAAHEGNWNPTMVTVWARDEGALGFSTVTRYHPIFKPSLELYFEDTWLGIHCFNRIGGENVFDEEFAVKIIDYIEANCEVE
jgi:hypothetical protein